MLGQYKETNYVLQVAGPMGIRVEQPTMRKLNSDSARDYLNALKDNVNSKNCQLVNHFKNPTDGQAFILTKIHDFLSKSAFKQARSI